LRRLVGAQLDVVQQRREQVQQQLGLVERQDELLELELELELLLALQRLAWPRWHRRNRQRLWQVSSWHHASTVRWCRFSRPSRLCRCASCRWFEHQQRMRALLTPTASLLCSVFSWSSS
jgi:hypothetical protein